MLGMRDQVFTRSRWDDVGPPLINNDALHTGRLGPSANPEFTNPNFTAGQAAQVTHAGQTFAGLNPEIAKSYFIHPTNQGQRAAMASRQIMLVAPRNNPSRSQTSEGYTVPLQLFTSNNTWQTPSGQSSRGVRQKQPSTKRVSPFATLPIPTRMPWDL